MLVWQRVNPYQYPQIWPWDIYDWIGLREIGTGNHRFSHEDHGAFRLRFSLKPIH